MNSRKLNFFVILFIAVSFLQPVALFSGNKSSLVYITKTGDKYHTATCKYLKSSKIQITLEDALKRGLTACKVCKP